MQTLANQKLPASPWPLVFYFSAQIKYYIIAAAFFSGIAAIISVFIPLTLKNIVDLLSSPESPQEVFNQSLIMLFALMALLNVAKAIFATCGRYAYTLLQLGPFRARIRKQFVDVLFKNDVDFFYNQAAGGISSNVHECARAIAHIVEDFVNHYFFFIISVVAMFFMFGNISLLFGAAFLGWLILYILFLVIYVPGLQNLSASDTHLKAASVGFLSELFSNINLVKIFSNFSKETLGYAEVSDRLAMSQSKVHAYWVWLRLYLPGLHLFLFITLASLSYHGFTNDIISVGEIVLALTLLPHLIEKSDETARLLSVFTGHWGTVVHCTKTLLVEPTIHDDEKAEKLDLINNKAEIAYKNMTFSYSENISPVLKDFSLKIESGQKIGLLGHSGAGKSTLINLLLRFYDPQLGSLAINDQNIKAVTQDSLRQNIAIIPQDTSLFQRSLLENIRYGSPEVTEEEVIAAAKQAHAHEFIETLPEGYDTLVGERGVKLSGGQRQRIAIARAILKNAPILILDEATSALDTESEKLIQQSLETLMQGKTVIAIAHRLSTIRHLDRLIVMEQGQIIEDGSHETLIKQNGTYAKLWNMQSGGFIGE